MKNQSPLLPLLRACIQPPPAMGRTLHISLCAIGLSAGAAAWGQSLSVPANSTQTLTSSSSYNGASTVDGVLNVGDGTQAAGAVVAEFNGAATVNSGGTENIATDGVHRTYVTATNHGVLTNNGKFEAAFSLSAPDDSALVLNNTGSFINNPGGSVWLGYVASAGGRAINTGTMTNAGHFEARAPDYAFDAWVRIENNGTFTLSPNGVLNAGSIDSYHFVNGAAGSSPGTLVVQATDDHGAILGRFENNSGSVVRFDPAAGTVQSLGTNTGFAGNARFVGAGEYQKSSSGTTVIYGIDYTGPTVVKEGTLVVNGSNASSASTTVERGATLSGSGWVSTVTVQAAGTLAPGNSLVPNSVGTLTVQGSADLQATSVAQFELGAPTAAEPTAGAAVTAGDLVVVNGDLQMNGNLQVKALPGMAPGAYKIFTYGGTLTNGASLDISEMRAQGLTAQIDVSVPGEVWLATKKLLPQTISFTSQAPTAAAVGGAAYQAGANADSGLPVTLTSTTPQVCTVQGGVVTFVGTGTCVLAADQPGDSTYLAAEQVTQSFAVANAPAPAPSPAGAPTPVPTLGQWAPMLLSTLLAGVAAAGLRRPRVSR
ncbi:MAG: IPTL-CTERM sorting domain-containing protein [Burkholderiaceae bacterium]|nr:IPTL-CTERM sorting domain-containing protein [Burkholderiaceae bacterium]